MFHDIIYSENAYFIVVQYKCPSCFNWQNEGRRGRNHMVVGNLQLNMQSVPITTSNVVRSNPDRWFSPGIPFSTTNKTDR